ncbi:hypothetical protein CIB84_003123, partial [Bambusicola thoracicus]
YWCVDDCLVKLQEELEHRGQQIRVERNLSKSKSCCTDKERSPYMGTTRDKKMNASALAAEPLAVSVSSQETLTMGAWGWMKDMFSYETPKLIRFPSVGCVCVKLIIYGVIAVYICYTLIVQKRYQKKEVLTSSVRVTLKGVAHTRDSFFVMTNIIQTENQTQQTCPEYPIAKAICSSDESCAKGFVDVLSNVSSMESYDNLKHKNLSITFEDECTDMLKLSRWYEVLVFAEQELVLPQEFRPENVPAVLRSSEDFTVFIKNNIHFPTLNYTVQNISPKLNTSCKFNKVTAPLCPIFRLGDILHEAKENYSEMAVRISSKGSNQNNPCACFQGGIIAIEIKWDCDLDSWSYYCSPEYSFRRLDDKTRTRYPGFSIRFARHYKLPDGTEQRTLFKAYGIRFDVLVFGMGGKFKLIELVTFIGSTIAYFGLAVTIIEVFFELYDCSAIYRCCKIQLCENVLRKKYETVLMPEQVMFVSYVDKPHITLIRMPLRTSLQNAEGSIFEDHPVKSYDPRTCCSHESDKHGAEESELRPLTQTSSSTKSPEWCCCGRCQVAQKYHEQLCCRKKEGQCITTTYWFTQLVLSRDTLNKVLLYEDPFLDLMGHSSNSQLRRIAYKQYIHWRFGSFQLEDRAIIPSCCKRLIRSTYPKENGNYTAFNLE